MSPASAAFQDGTAPAADVSAARDRPPLPGRLATDQGLIYPVLDPVEPGVVQHSAGLFVLHFPGHWRVGDGVGPRRC